MMTIGRRLWDWAFPSQQPPWPPSTVEPSVLDSSCLYEEELVPIALQNFYPMQMGEVINDRYQITAKLGFGGRSTVWLARDLRTSTKCLSNYVSIKVTVTNDEDKEICDNELERLIHITHANRGHSGYYAVRTLLEHYFIHGPAGEHLCLVFEPLRDSLFTLKHHWPDHKVPAKVLKVVAKVMLQALNYLHTQCHIIHGDISETNIIFSIPDTAGNEMLEQHSQRERTEPSPVKILADRTVYLTHHVFGPVTSNLGVPYLIDFGNAVPGDDPRFGLVAQLRPEGCETPEGWLGARCSYSKDIWNLAFVLCNVVENKSIFAMSDKESLARMIDLLGPPPQSLLQRCEGKDHFFDERENFRFPELMDRGLSFETFFSSVEGQDKELFIAFIKRMMRWEPDKRASAQELLTDPWLKN